MLELRLFGRPRLAAADGELTFAANRKTVALLAYLVMRRQTPIARDYLASVLWPDDPEDAGRANLRRHLHLLVKALPVASGDVPYVVTTQHTMRWNPAAPVRIDVIDFQRASLETAERERAAELYTAPFLEEYYDDWIVAERERLLGTQLENLYELVQRKRGRHDLRGALADVVRILALDPWREDAVRSELYLKDRLGDRSGALGAYRAFAERLRRDLDTDPMPETRAVYESLLRGRELPDDAISAATNEAISDVRSLPFHGRDAALDTLTRAWTTAAMGSGTFSAVGGEAGVGKSRLVAELTLRAEAQGARVFAGGTSPHEPIAYEAIVDCLHGASTLLETCALPAPTLATLGRLVPAFAATEHPTAALGPEAERFALFEAVSDAFAALARSRPVVVVVEDVHWAGNATLALLEFLAFRCAKKRIAFFVTYREDEIGRAHPFRAFRRKLERTPNWTHVALQRLDRATIGAIVRDLRPRDDDLESTIDDLYTNTEGLPVYLESALRDGTLAGARDGGLRLDNRLATLTPEARAVLDVASVIGVGFDVEVLREILGWSEAEVLASIDRLIAAYIVRESHRKRRTDLTFTHHLLAEAVYARLDDAERTRRHGQIARVLSELYADAFDERAAIVALHWERSGEAERAARAYAIAARRSQAFFASDEVRRFASSALALTSEPRLRCEMLLLREHASFRLGDRDAQDRDLVELAPIACGTEHHLEYLLGRARLALVRGKLDEAARSIGEAQPIVASRDDRAARVAAATLEGSLLAKRGDFAAARAKFDGALETCERDGDDAGFMRVLEATMTASMEALDMASVTTLGTLMLERARRAGDVEREAAAHEMLGAAIQRQGAIGEALEHLTTAKLMFERVGAPARAMRAGCNAALAQLMLGRYVVAARALEAALPYFEALEDSTGVAVAHGNLAAIYVLMGDFDRALASATVALAAHGDARGGLYAQVLVTVGTAHAMAGRYDEASRHLAEALERIRPYGDSDVLGEALLLGITISLHRADVRAAQAYRAEIRRMSPQSLAHGFSPELYPWHFAEVARLEGDAGAEAAYRDQAVRSFEAHLERLAPDGRDAYRRVPFIVPLSAYAMGTATISR